MGERSLHERVIELEQIVHTQGVIINELRERLEDTQPPAQPQAESRYPGLVSPRS